MVLGNDFYRMEPDVDRRGGVQLDRQAGGNRPTERRGQERECIRRRDE
jgi:hypothetical protein